MNWKKRSLAFFLVLCTIFTILPPVTAKAADTEMNIYCIYLGAEDENAGDSILVESKGEYLLMDLGPVDSYSYVKKFLKERGVKTLSLYISHTHADHTGGLQQGEGYHSLLKDFNVEHVYVPDESIVKDMDLSSNHEKFVKWYEEVYPDADIKQSITYLKVGSTFTFGDVSAEVIGPVGMDKKKVKDFMSEAKERNPKHQQDEAENIYLNNASLVSILTCGKTKFFTGGDIDTYEEQQLASKYGKALKADIYKMSHHGYANSSTADIMKYIKPTYTFAPNSGAANGFTDPKTTNQRKSKTAMDQCSHYGFVYLVGAEKDSSAFKVTNNAVKIYRTSDLEHNLSGYFAVEGADGTNVKQDHYYFDENGKPLTGVQTVTINGKKQKHYFGDGGREEYGLYINGKYNPWRTYDEKKKWFRYFDEKTHEMMTGLVKENSTDWYFCDSETGLRMYGFIEYKGKTYYVGNKTVYRKKWLTGTKDIGKKGERYYFDKNGVMAVGWVTTHEGKKYYFNEDGTRAHGLTQIGKKYYYFNNTGETQKKNYTVTVDGVTLKFNNKGVLTNVPTSKKPTLKSANASGKKVTVTWKKVSKASGYTVYMSTKKNKGYEEILDVKSSKTSAKTGKLAPGTYYFKVASYRTIDGVKFYSKQSSAKTVVIK